MRSLTWMGVDWANLAIRHQCQPTTTGNIEHDRACAEQFFRETGTPPQWYTEERFGAIYERGHPMRKYVNR